MNRETNCEAPVSSLWEQFQQNGEKIVTGENNASDTSNTKPSNHLILFVNGK